MTQRALLVRWLSHIGHWPHRKRRIGTGGPRRGVAARRSGHRKQLGAMAHVSPKKESVLEDRIAQDKTSVVSRIKCHLIASLSSPLSGRHWSHSLGYDDEKQRRHRVLGPVSKRHLSPDTTLSTFARPHAPKEKLETLGSSFGSRAGGRAWRNDDRPRLAQEGPACGSYSTSPAAHWLKYEPGQGQFSKILMHTDAPTGHGDAPPTRGRAFTHQAKLPSTKSQFTSELRKVSTHLGRRLR